MAEYIERKPLLELIEWFIEHSQDGSHEYYAYKTCRRMIKDTTVADVIKVKYGYWKDTEYGTCSVCNRSISEIYDADSSMSYGILDELIACPFCGAKMDGSDKNG